MSDMNDFTKYRMITHFGSYYPCAAAKTVLATLGIYGLSFEASCHLQLRNMNYYILGCHATYKITNCLTVDYVFIRRNSSGKIVVRLCAKILYERAYMMQFDLLKSWLTVYLLVITRSVAF